MFNFNLFETTVLNLIPKIPNSAYYLIEKHNFGEDIARIKRFFNKSNPETIRLVRKPNNNDGTIIFSFEGVVYKKSPYCINIEIAKDKKEEFLSIIDFSDDWATINGKVKITIAAPATAGQEPSFLEYASQEFGLIIKQLQLSCNKTIISPLYKGKRIKEIAEGEEIYNNAYKTMYSEFKSNSYVDGLLNLATDQINSTEEPTSKKLIEDYYEVLLYLDTCQKNELEAALELEKRRLDALHKAKEQAKHDDKLINKRKKALEAKDPTKKHFTISDLFSETVRSIIILTVIAIGIAIAAVVAVAFFQVTISLAVTIASVAYAVLGSFSIIPIKAFVKFCKNLLKIKNNIDNGDEDYTKEIIDDIKESTKEIKVKINNLEVEKTDTIKTLTFIEAFNPKNNVTTINLEDQNLNDINVGLICLNLMKDKKFAACTEIDLSKINLQDDGCIAERIVKIINATKDTQITSISLPAKEQYASADIDSITNSLCKNFTLIKISYPDQSPNPCNKLEEQLAINRYLHNKNPSTEDEVEFLPLARNKIKNQLKSIIKDTTKNLEEELTNLLKNIGDTQHAHKALMFALTDIVHDEREGKQASPLKITQPSLRLKIFLETCKKFQPNELQELVKKMSYQDINSLITEDFGEENNFKLLQKLDDERRAILLRACFPPAIDAYGNYDYMAKSIAIATKIYPENKMDKINDYSLYDKYANFPLVVGIILALPNEQENINAGLKAAQYLTEKCKLIEIFDAYGRFVEIIKPIKQPIKTKEEIKEEKNLDDQQELFMTNLDAIIEKDGVLIAKYECINVVIEKWEKINIIIASILSKDTTTLEKDTKNKELAQKFSEESYIIKRINEILDPTQNDAIKEKALGLLENEMKARRIIAIKNILKQELGATELSVDNYTNEKLKEIIQNKKNAEFKQGKNTFFRGIKEKLGENEENEGMHLLISKILTPDSTLEENIIQEKLLKQEMEKVKQQKKSSNQENIFFIIDNLISSTTQNKNDVRLKLTSEIKRIIETFEKIKEKIEQQPLVSNNEYDTINACVRKIIDLNATASGIEKEVAILKKDIEEKISAIDEEVAKKTKALMSAIEQNTQQKDTDRNFLTTLQKFIASILNKPSNSATVNINSTIVKINPDAIKKNEEKLINFIKNFVVNPTSLAFLDFKEQPIDIVDMDKVLKELLRNNIFLAHTTINISDNLLSVKEIVSFIKAIKVTEVVGILVPKQTIDQPDIDNITEILQENFFITKIDIEKQDGIDYKQLEMQLKINAYLTTAEDVDLDIREKALLKIKEYLNNKLNKSDKKEMFMTLLGTKPSIAVCKMLLLATKKGEPQEKDYTSTSLETKAIMLQKVLLNAQENPCNEKLFQEVLKLFFKQGMFGNSIVDLTIMTDEEFIDNLVMARINTGIIDKNDQEKITTLNTILRLKNKFNMRLDYTQALENRYNKYLDFFISNCKDIEELAFEQEFARIASAKNLTEELRCLMIQFTSLSSKDDKIRIDEIKKSDFMLMPEEIRFDLLYKKFKKLASLEVDRLRILLKACFPEQGVQQEFVVKSIIGAFKEAVANGITEQRLSEISAFMTKIFSPNVTLDEARKAAEKFTKTSIKANISTIIEKVDTKITPKYFVTPGATQATKVVSKITPKYFVASGTAQAKIAKDNTIFTKSGARMKDTK